jgi:DNA-binding NarL/FixJ family response regulator
MIRTGVIEDDPQMVARITDALRETSDIRVVAVANNFRDGAALIAAGGFDVLLCDIGLPDGSGIDLIRQASTLMPEMDIIVITIFGDTGKVLDAIKAGARGYLLKDDHVAQYADSIRQLRAGGSPISPIIARQLLKQLQPEQTTALVAPESSPAAGLEALSARESEVLNLLARGFSYAEVATFLSLSPATIGTYVKRIYRKLEVKSRSEAVFEASSRGILNVH